MTNTTAVSQTLTSALSRLGQTSSLIARTALALTVVLSLGLSSIAAHAQDFNENLLHSFTGYPADGDNPDTALINVNGTFYGATEFGGDSARGTIYSFNPSTNTETTLYSFSDYPNLNGGIIPQGGLVYDSASGKIFGTTGQGGTGNGGNGNGIGTIFSFDPSTNTVSFPYSFKNHGDGEYPNTRMIDVNGTLYGTTSGTVFSYNDTTKIFRTLHSFNSNVVDGDGPAGDLTYDSTRGLLYGTTNGGGSNNTGTIYSIKPDGTGYQVLYSFGSSASSPSDGNFPAGGLTEVSGIFYGTAEGGGTGGFGTVFAFDPTTNTETTLYSFQGIPSGAASGDGSRPAGDLTYDSTTGELLGITEIGGIPGSAHIGDSLGTVFAIKPDGTGYHQVYAFQGAPTDGTNPISGLLDVSGILYGTTAYGGASDQGAIYSLTPTTFTLPHAVNDRYVTFYQGTYVVSVAKGVLVNDNPGGSNKLTATLVSSVTHGTLTFHSDGSFSYTSANGFIGTDTFTYYDTNPLGKSNTATVTLIVQAIAPIARPDAYTTDYNTALTVAAPGVLANDNPGDNGTVTANLVTNPSHGTLTFSTDGSFIYTPNTGFIGTDSFTYNATNDIGTGNTATVNIKVQTVPPHANADSYTLLRNTTLTVKAPGILANDTPGSGSTLSATLVGYASHGSLTLNSDGSFVYTPTTGFVGTDFFVYKDTTDLGTSSNVEVTLNIQPDLPTAVDDTYAPSYQTALVVPAPGVLANDDSGGSTTLSAALVSNVSHGTLTLGSNGSFTYTPANGFLGTDTFTYKDTNTTGTGNTATVTLTVQAVDPVANDDTYSVGYNTPLTVSAPGVLTNDDPGAPGTLTAALVTQPAHGTLTFHTDGSFTYTPNSGYIGSDSFTYEDTNTVGTSNTATVTLTVLPVLPTAANDTYTLFSNTTLTITAPGVLANDNAGGSSTLSAALVSNPTHGTLSFFSDGSFTYTPTTGFTGTDSFTYQAVNGAGTSNTATVTLTVGTAPTVPIAHNDSASVKYNTPFYASAPGVLGNDQSGGGTLTAQLDSNPKYGSVVLNSDGSFTYTPFNGFTGRDSFTYQAVNAAGKSNIATVSLSCLAVPPIAHSDNSPVQLNTTLHSPAPGVLRNDDNSGSPYPMSAALVTTTTHGTLTLNADGSFDYTPNTGYLGTDSFTYQAVSIVGKSNTATCTLTVSTFPTAVNDVYSLKYNTVLTISAPGVLGNDNNGSNPTCTAVLVSNPSHGTVTLNSDGSFTYTPAAGFTGRDTFTYQDSNHIGMSNIATVTLNCLAVPPVAHSDSATVQHNMTFVCPAPGILRNDDNSGSPYPMTAQLVAGPGHGTLSLHSDGSFTYTPNSGYSGSDSFTYQAVNAVGKSNIAPVTLNVQ